MTSPYMSERDFTAAVIAAARRAGWLVHHDDVSAQLQPYFEPSGRRRWRRVRANATAGFPDLVLLHRTRRLLVFAELKRDAPAHTVAAGAHGRDLSGSQTEWLVALDDARGGLRPPFAHEVRIWRPVQLEAIYAFLTAEAAPCP